MKTKLQYELKEDETIITASELAVHYESQAIPATKMLGVSFEVEKRRLMNLDRYQNDHSFEDAKKLKTLVTRSDRARMAAEAFKIDAEMLKPSEQVKVKRSDFGIYIPADREQFREQREKALRSGRSITVRGQVLQQILERDIEYSMSRAEELLRFEKGELTFEQSRTLSQFDERLFADQPDALQRHYEKAVTRVIESSALEKEIRDKKNELFTVKAIGREGRLTLAPREVTHEKQNDMEIN